MKRCTMCGKKLDTVDLYGNFSFKHRVGYGSKYDGDVIYLTVCYECFDQVVDILSMMSKEKIIFSPQELSENDGYYGKWDIQNLTASEMPTIKGFSPCRKSHRLKRVGRQADHTRFTADGNADRVKVSTLFIPEKALWVDERCFYGNCGSERQKGVKYRHFTVGRHNNEKYGGK